MDRARVLLADDHAIVAEGLGRLLSQEFELLGIVGDGRAMVDAVRTLQPDVVVADISMPHLNGLEALRELDTARATKVIFLTMHADPALATTALRAGASGYVLKQAAGDELITAIREVLAGHMYLTPLLTREVLHGLIDTTPASADAPTELTPRQREVLRLLVAGRTMKEIAATLQLSTRTVESYKYAMMHALGVATTAELIQYAFRSGLAGDAPDGASAAAMPGAIPDDPTGEFP